MANLVSFTPLLRSTVGFDRFNDLFEKLVDGGSEARFDSYPPYNIEKTGENDYRIVMAVAGFSPDDLSITVEKDNLMIAGRIAEKEGEGAEVAYLHRGIATRAFQRSFRLMDHIKPVGAETRDGLLVINLVREVPEEAKPRTIPISGSASKVIDAKEKGE